MNGDGNHCTASLSQCRQMSRSIFPLWTGIRVLNKVKGDRGAGCRPAPSPPLHLRSCQHFGFLDEQPPVPFFPAQHFQRHLLHFRQLVELDGKHRSVLFSKAAL